MDRLQVFLTALEPTLDQITHLIDILEQERQVLRENALDKLQLLVQDKDKLLQEIQEVPLNNARLLETLDFDPNNLEPFTHKLNSTQKTHFDALWPKLIDKLAHFSRLRQTNEIVIARLLSQTNRLMATFNGLVESVTYGADAGLVQGADRILPLGEA